MTSAFRRALVEAGVRLSDPEPVELPVGMPEPAIRGAAKRLAEREEADLCDTVAEWLRGEGFEVFFEVPLGKGRPDIVAFRADATLAVEAKLSDVKGVVKQAQRIASKVDAPYIAMPLGAAGEAARTLAFLERKNPRMTLPGIMAVGNEVAILRPPTGQPRRRAATAALRAAAERYGAERGGVPSTDQMARNAEIWREWALGMRWREIGSRFVLSESGAQAIVKRIKQWREHLKSCDDRPCVALSKSERSYFAGAHKHALLLGMLPPGRGETVTNVEEMAGSEAPA